MFINFNLFFGTMIRRRTNKWRQQAPLFYYWNVYVERQRRREEKEENLSEENLSEHTKFLAAGHWTRGTVLS